MAAPLPPPQQVTGQHEQHRGPGQRHQIEPLVPGQRKPERHLEVRQIDSLDAAGPFLQQAEFEELRRRDRERERGEREIMAFEPQRRKAEEESNRQADRAGNGNRRPIGHARVLQQHRGGVGADGIECPVPEGNLAAVAGDEIEAEKGDGINRHACELQQVVAARDERHGAGHDSQENDCGRTPPRRASGRHRCLHGPLRDRHVRPATSRHGRTGPPAEG